MESVLVVDDEPRIAALMATILRKRFPVDVAHSCDAAFASFEEHGYSAVFVDYLMPGGTGDALAKKIKMRWPETKVVIVTGNKDLCAKSIEDFEDMYDYPCVDAFIGKPFSVGDVLKVAETLLG